MQGWVPVSVSGIDRCVGSTQHDLFRARLLAPVCIQLGEVMERGGGGGGVDASEYWPTICCL